MSLYLSHFSDINHVSKIQVMLNDNGTETVIFQNESQVKYQSDEFVEHYDRVITQEDEERMLVEEHYLHGDRYTAEDYSKGRRNRVYGQARCPECGQTFINTARLERHMSVHAVSCYNYVVIV